MMKHNEFRKGGRVSVWVGNFISDVELDDYLNLSRNFEKDFGFELNERDMPETTVEPQAVPILKLVEGFSWSSSYAAAVAEMAKQQGIEIASTLVVFLNFEYQPDRAKPKESAPLTFLGVVPFS